MVAQPRRVPASRAEKDKKGSVVAVSCKQTSVTSGLLPNGSSANETAELDLSTAGLD